MRPRPRPGAADEVRWHTSKSDPARFEPLFDAFAEALPVVREMLDARPALPSRGRYVDIPRLTKHLDADRFRKTRRMGPLVRTLESSISERCGQRVLDHARRRVRIPDSSSPVMRPGARRPVEGRRERATAASGPKSRRRRRLRSAKCPSSGLASYPKSGNTWLRRC